MKTRLGCFSHKSDSCTDLTEFLAPAHETTARCLKLSTDEVLRWSESFDHVVSHKYGLAAFQAFLKTEFSDENIEFWMACEDYKKLKSSTKLLSKANHIFKEFIDVQAPREVNIDYRTREKTKRSLEEPPPPAASTKLKLSSTLSWQKIPILDSSSPNCTRILSRGQTPVASGDLSDAFRRRPSMEHRVTTLQEDSVEISNDTSTSEETRGHACPKAPSPLNCRAQHNVNGTEGDLDLKKIPSNNITTAIWNRS